MADLFTTNTLTKIVQDLRTPKTGFADAIFTIVMEEDTEEIHFDADNKPRRMSPFVSPLVAGQVVRSRGFNTSTFKPAYVKDKRVFTPTRAIKRMMGERIGGAQLTPQQRMQALVAMDLQDQLEMLQRRVEWMCAQALYSGSITVAGDNYPSVTVNFGRDSSLTVTLTGSNRWGQAGINPLDSLQDWSDLMMLASGVGISEVTMTVDAWKIFRANSEVAKRLDRMRGTSTMQQNAANAREGRVYQGTIDNLDIFTYSGWVVDPSTDTQGTILPAGTVICTAAPDLVEGVQHYGAILDHDALFAQQYFPKSWLEDDPSVRYLLLQSAPLPVPYRINATFRATVL